MPMGEVIGGGRTCMEKFRVNGVGLGVKVGVGGHLQIFLVLVHVHECIERLGSLVFGKFFWSDGSFFLSIGEGAVSWGDVGPGGTVKG